jgi:hypothetical protein
VIEPPTDAMIIDGAALINSRQPEPCKTFDEYANEIILPYIEHCGQRHGRIDVVFDVYYDKRPRGHIAHLSHIG